jgi:hypothetical protein
MLLHIQKPLAGFSFFGKGVRTYSSQARSLLHVRAGIRPGTNLFNHPDICLLLSEGKRGICMMMVLHVIGWRFPRRPHMIDDSDMRVHVVINQYSTRTPYHVTITLHRAYLASQLHE